MFHIQQTVFWANRYIPYIVPAYGWPVMMDSHGGISRGGMPHMHPIRRAQLVTTDESQRSNMPGGGVHMEVFMTSLSAMTMF